MIRCGKCNKSKHYLCERAKCECNCRKYADNIINRMEPERDHTHDKYYDDFNKRWLTLQKKLHPPVKVKSK